MPNISPELLSHLRCPVTASPLKQEGDFLVATQSAADGTVPRYRIEDGIPILLKPEFLPPAGEAASRQRS